MDFEPLLGRDLAPIVGEKALCGEEKASDAGAHKDCAFAVVKGKPTYFVYGYLLGLVVQVHSLSRVALYVGLVGEFIELRVAPMPVVIAHAGVKLTSA